MEGKLLAYLFTLPKLFEKVFKWLREVQVDPNVLSSHQQAAISPKDPNPSLQQAHKGTHPTKALVGMQTEFSVLALRAP